MVSSIFIIIIVLILPLCFYYFWVMRPWFKEINDESWEDDDDEYALEDLSLLDISTLEERASQGDSDALIELGERYFTGSNVLSNTSQDIPQDVSLNTAQSILPNTSPPVPQSILSSIPPFIPQDISPFTPQDFKKALSYYEQACEQGDKTAQYLLAERYYDGDGVSKDHAKAFLYYEQAAKQGYSLAQYYLAEMYQDGDGVTQDAEKAAEWFGKVMECGDRELEALLYMVEDAKQNRK